MKKHLLIILLSLCYILGFADTPLYNIKITGAIENKAYYGPPNYGETPEMDITEKVYIITLDVPIKITIGGKTEYIECMQIIQSKMEQTIDLSKLSSGTFIGDVFEAETGHHHTKYIFLIKK